MCARVRGYTDYCCAHPGISCRAPIGNERRHYLGTLAIYAHTLIQGGVPIGRQVGKMCACYASWRVCKDMGYTTSMRVHDAAKHGSLAPRERLWIFGVLGTAAEHRDKVTTVHSVFNAMRIPTLSPKLFFGNNFEVFDEAVQEGVERGACRIADPACRDEHIEAYRQAELPYPPNLSEFPEGLREAVRPLTQRMKELVLFVEQTEPWLDESTPQFFDANQSAKFLLSANSIFSDRCPTLASSSKIWARVQIDSQTRKWALLPGRVLMSLVGYPGRLHDADNSNLMASFAGNAFSAFTIGPLWIALMSAMAQK